MSHKRKLFIGIIFGFIYYLTYTSVLFFVKNPYREVDCKIGRYTFTIQRKDCKTAFKEITHEQRSELY